MGENPYLLPLLGRILHKVIAVVQTRPPVKVKCGMKKKIVPILLAFVILFVLLTVINPGFREKIHVVIGYISNWLGIDWGSIRGWQSAELLLCQNSFAIYL